MYEHNVREDTEQPVEYAKIVQNWNTLDDTN